jgi:hypothetical protein
MANQRIQMVTKRLCIDRGMPPTKEAKLTLSSIQNHALSQSAHFIPVLRNDGISFCSFDYFDRDPTTLHASRPVFHTMTGADRRAAYPQHHW